MLSPFIVVLQATLMFCLEQESRLRQISNTWPSGSLRSANESTVKEFWLKAGDLWKQFERNISIISGTGWKFSQIFWIDFVASCLMKDFSFVDFTRSRELSLVTIGIRFSWNDEKSSVSQIRDCLAKDDLGESTRTTTTSMHS